MKKWFKENWEEFLSGAVVLGLIVTNIGGFVSAYKSHTLNFWDISSLMLIFLFMALTYRLIGKS